MKKQSTLNLETPCVDPKHIVNVSNSTATVSIPPINEYTAKAVQSLSDAAKANADAIKEIASALHFGNQHTLIGMKIDCGSSK